MITTGWPYSKGAHTEVLDLLNPEPNCSPGLDFPVEIQGATGGLQSCSRVMLQILESKKALFYILDFNG